MASLASRLVKLSARATAARPAPPVAARPWTDADWAALFDRWAADLGPDADPGLPAAAAAFRAAVGAGDAAATEHWQTQILGPIARAAAVEAVPGPRPGTEGRDAGCRSEDLP